jgi:hypothetical protein
VSDGTTEDEFLLFDKIAAEALAKPLVIVLHHMYPGHAMVEALASAARLNMGIPPKISRLIGQKFRSLVCISKKWRSKNSDNENLFSRSTGLKKPTSLSHHLVFLVQLSAGASLSANGSKMLLPLLGPFMSPNS